MSVSELTEPQESLACAWGSCEFDGKDKGVPLLFWGARAIFQGGELDFLPDRQGWAGTMYDEFDKTRTEEFEDWRNRPEPKGFIEWLEHVVKPTLNRWLQTQDSSSGERLIIDHGKFHYRASCRQSCGYCYIAAWRDK